MNTASPTAAELTSRAIADADSFAAKPKPNTSELATLAAALAHERYVDDAEDAKAFAKSARLLREACAAEAAAAAEMPNITEKMTAIRAAEDATIKKPAKFPCTVKALHAVAGGPTQAKRAAKFAAWVGQTRPGYVRICPGPNGGPKIIPGAIPLKKWRNMKFSREDFMLYVRKIQQWKQRLKANPPQA